jgi:hypothetical protein
MFRQFVQFFDHLDAVPCAAFHVEIGGQWAAAASPPPRLVAPWPSHHLDVRYHLQKPLRPVRNSRRSSAAPRESSSSLDHPDGNRE